MLLRALRDVPQGALQTHRIGRQPCKFALRLLLGRTCINSRNSANTLHYQSRPNADHRRIVSPWTGSLLSLFAGLCQRPSAKHFYVDDAARSGAKVHDFCKAAHDGFVAIRLHSLLYVRLPVQRYAC
jgi:hypothetical protein